MKYLFVIILLVLGGLCIWGGWILWPMLYLVGVALLLLGFLGVHDLIQKKKAILSNFPIVGHGRAVAHWMRPKVHQYFIESDTEGKPFSKLERDIIYHRADQTTDTTPFGTQRDVYAEGYEWMNHSIAAIDPHDLDDDPRVMIGGPACSQPYHASLLNISAMSYGSLSKNAVMALNGGAALGNFAHNTGEGGISPYHDKYNGDLIYQVGTGYFGCRAEDGNFSPELFAERCAKENVKMIELKLSQGAKPGHGGILPAKKVTEEISKIRNVPMGVDVLSPPYHKAFNSPKGLLKLIQKMRELSGGKPIGFKLCIGHRAEFLSICKAMIATGIKPDFISVDGGEGGTGAAPLEFSNSVGMPFKEGLAFAYNALEGFGIKKDIKLIGSGKVVSGFHMFRALALGADACNSARAMMMAIGCIQALECNKNTCPTGVATQKPHLVRGLDVNDKKVKVANYHEETVKNFVELMGASGLKDPDAINRSHLYRRIEMDNSRRFDEIYPYIPSNCLLHHDSIPDKWKFDMSLSSADEFLLRQPLGKLHL